MSPSAGIAGGGTPSEGSSPVNPFRDVQETVTVELRFHLAVLKVPNPFFTHAFIVVTDNTGEETYFRGDAYGPGRETIPGQGSLQAEYGPFVQGSPDWGPDAQPYPPSGPAVTLYHGHGSTARLDAVLARYASAVNRAQLPYYPRGTNDLGLGYNSNSFAYAAPHAAGLTVPANPPVFQAPGWGTTIPVIPY